MVVPAQILWDRRSLACLNPRTRGTVDYRLLEAGRTVFETRVVIAIGMRDCIPIDNLEACLELRVSKSEHKCINEELHDLIIGDMQLTMNTQQRTRRRYGFKSSRTPHKPPTTTQPCEHTHGDADLPNSASSHAHTAYLSFRTRGKG